MTRTLTRVAFGLVAAVALATFIRDDRFSLLIRGVVVVLAVVACWRPWAALLGAALAAPFADVLLITAGAPPVRAPELIVVAFLSGWLFSGVIRGGSRAAALLSRPAIVLTTVVLSSIVQVALELYRANPGALSAVLATTRVAYFSVGEPIGLIRGAEILEGIALVFAVVEIARARASFRTEMAAVFAITAAAAALFAVLLPFGIGLPVSLSRQAAAGPGRFAAHIGDVNAAGSYYVLAGGIAWGLTAASALSRRLLGWFSAALALVGLVISGSRSALVAALLVALGIVALRAMQSRWAVVLRLAAAMAVVAAVVAAIAIAAHVPMLMSLAEALEMRRDFAVASLRMIAARPMLGVGMGRYVELSRLVFSPALARSYGYENAHNYLMQLCAEIGIVGLAAFAWFIASALRPPLRMVRSRRGDDEWLGLLAGLVGFMLTWAGGHPLLVAEAAIPFWMALGLAASAGEPVAIAAGSRRRAIVAAAVIALIGSVPFRPGVPRLRLPPGSDGFGPVREADGTRYREVEKASALFLHPNVTFVEIPIRLAASRNGRPVMVALRQARWSVHPVFVTSAWVSTPVTLPQADPLAPYQRIDIEVLPGSDPPGHPLGGVDVGDVRILGVRE